MNGYEHGWTIANWGLGAFFLFYVLRFIGEMIRDPPKWWLDLKDRDMKSKEKLSDAMYEMRTAIFDLQNAYRGLETLHDDDSNRLAEALGRVTVMSENSTRMADAVDRLVSKFPPREQWSEAQRDSFRKEVSA